MADGAGSAAGAEGADAFDPVAFLERAVRIPSHEDVTEMRSFLVETLDAHGVAAEVDATGNVLASKGSDAADATHLVLNTHIDTVSPHVPYAREGADDAGGGVIRGRGSCDAKGPLAALLAAFLAVDPGANRVTLAVTPDEETLSTGAAALVGADEEAEPFAAADADDSVHADDGEGPLDADAFIVGEPTDLDVCTAAKGRFEGTVRLSGANAHAAEPHTGVNAVAAVEGVLAAVRTFDADAAREATDGAVDAVADDHPDLGTATLTPTVVRGGQATNQVPADCRLTVDRRSVPPETAADFREALTAHVRAAVPDEVGVEFRLTERDTPFLEAFATDPDHDLVRTLSNAAREAGDRRTGAPDGGAVRPFAAATEASYFAPAPTVVFGPGALTDEEGAVAHADREYVRVAEVEAAAEAVAETVRTLVG